MNGNSLPDIEVYKSNLIYSISDFLQNCFLDLYCCEFIDNNSKKQNYKNINDYQFINDYGTHKKYKLNEYDSQVIKDLNSLNEDQFLIKY